MRVLFVNPVKSGSGETITTLHMAKNLVHNGHEVLFLASPFAQRFVGTLFADRMRSLGEDGPANVVAWEDALSSFHPHLIVFADYPLMFFASDVSPLVLEPAWLDRLNEVDAELATLDHFGFAQRAMRVLLGPAHIGMQYQEIPAVPPRMHVLLPCPMHEPGTVVGRVGSAFRYWDVPVEVSRRHRRKVRRRFLEHEDDVLIFHALPYWAVQGVEALGMPLYAFWPRLMNAYLEVVPQRVTVVSVNNGSLLQSTTGDRLRIVNSPPIQPDEFEALLQAADLFVTENRVSISLGKAVCALRPCAALVNGYSLPEALEHANEHVRDTIQAMERVRLGSVFPHDVYPVGMTHLLDEIILYRNNSLTEAFWTVQLYGGDATAAAFAQMLSEDAQEQLRSRQRAYVEKVRELPEPSLALEKLCR